MEEELSYLKVDYRKDLNILFCRWVNPFNSHELHTGYLFALQKARELEVNRWLLDLRRRGPASTEDELWLLNEFFPMVKKKIHGHHAFAYLVTPTHYQHIRDGVSFDKIRNYVPGVTILVFDAEEKAVEWLTSAQAV